MNRNETAWLFLSCFLRIDNSAFSFLPSGPASVFKYLSTTPISAFALHTARKQWQEAAALYESAGCYEAAVSVYLRCKNYKKAGDLLLTKVVNAPRLQLQYAKAREADGAYREAVVAYEAAHDWDSVVRLHLDKLSNPEEAVRVVHETKSIEGAKMIAQYFTRINDHTSAIRFLVMSKCLDAAFELARKHKKMELYAEVIGSDASTSEYQSIACYFESEKNWYLAGKFYLLAKQYEKAVRHLLRAPYSGDSPALDLALEAVGMAGDTRLTHLLIVYLMGETDGVPKDARHLFRLYMVLKQYKEAARTAVIIAREEQTAGNYRSAHDLLYSMVQELRRRELRVPAEMTDNLALLHSYILAKVHVKLGDHVRAARMLIRVAENISKFPAHVVPILTSTVIECQKAGLKAASFGYAAMLLRPEYRDKLDPKHRRKFETLIRRPDRKSMNNEAGAGAPDADSNSVENERLTPCPSCLHPLLASVLYCTECRSTLPYCIITGNHVIKNDLTVCPGCQFPANYSDMMSFVENTESPTCPMCSAELKRDSIRRITDPSKVLNAWIVNVEEPEEQDVTKQ
ncbi:WD repeat-containing protein 19 [Fasciola gigantica]|uniref:WD repeat-containing protein 19 n=1 Tax=Fasciola gigantica TaxID=46835 RepID=A0A504ZD95_FASGI|nr:WD repeat-containing protein 19 [Fasciola gigantica]